MFALTKPVEFIDTLFVVLRKQKMHFLHWFHHASVLVICWYSGGAIRGPTVALYFATMNSFVHSIMYSFYAAKVALLTF